LPDLGTAIRYVLTGILSLGVDTGLLILFHGLLAWPVSLATALAFGLTACFNFLVNQRWSFAAPTSHSRGQAIRFATLVAANLVANVLGVTALTAAGVQYVAAKLITAVILAVINLFIMRRWVFPPGQAVVG